MKILYLDLNLQSGVLPDKIQFLTIKINQISNMLSKYPIVIKTILYILKTIWQHSKKKMSYDYLKLKLCQKQWNSGDALRSLGLNVCEHQGFQPTKPDAQSQRWTKQN